MHISDHLSKQHQGDLNMHRYKNKILLSSYKTLINPSLSFLGSGDLAVNILSTMINLFYEAQLEHFY